MAKTYRGLTFKDWRINSSSFRRSDIELVKIDLLNHIFTEKGSRLMMPKWGTRIPSLMFEQNDEISKSIVEEDIKEVIKADPRVKLLSLQVLNSQTSNSLIALVNLLYVEFNVTENLNIEVPRK